MKVDGLQKQLAAIETEKTDITKSQQRLERDKSVLKKTLEKVRLLVFLRNCPCPNGYLPFSITVPVHPRLGYFYVTSDQALLHNSTTPLCPFVGWSVGCSVTPHFFAVSGLTAPAQIVKTPEIRPLPACTRLG